MREEFNAELDQDIANLNEISTNLARIEDELRPINIILETA